MLRSSARWGVTRYFHNPLIGPSHRLENGYTVGRDAGRLIVSAPTAILEGDVDASVFNGARQTRVRDALDDGYRQAQNAVTRAGVLAIGQYGPLGRAGVYDSDIRIGAVSGITVGVDMSFLLPAEREHTVWLDAGRLNAQRLGGLQARQQGHLGGTVHDPSPGAGGASPLAGALLMALVMF